MGPLHSSERCIYIPSEMLSWRSLHKPDIFELHELELNKKKKKNNTENGLFYAWYYSNISATHILTLQISLRYQNRFLMYIESENWIFQMYGDDGAGPAPSLYIGTIVPMISLKSSKGWTSPNG